MTRWEYQVVNLNPNLDSDDIDSLDEEGEVGWELVQVIANVPPSPPGWQAIFKRPLERGF